jgi:ribose 5-phosphate isomerase B
MNLPEYLLIASDHAGFSLKRELVAGLAPLGVLVTDLGTSGEASCNYTDFAHPLCHKVLETGAFGILVCGTGIGMSMAANRHRGIRAAVCTHEFLARAARAHNDANILCLGSRVTAPGLALEMARVFLTTPFEGGRHQPRIDNIEI